VQDAKLAVNDDVPGVRPFPSHVQHHLELTTEFVRRPEVVIVEKRDPVSPCVHNASVASATLAFGRFMAHDANPRLVKPGHGFVGVVLRAIVDDNDLEVHRPL
jgi:hypothetical protein